MNRRNIVVGAIGFAGLVLAGLAPAAAHGASTQDAPNPSPTTPASSSPAPSSSTPAPSATPSPTPTATPSPTPGSSATGSPSSLLLPPAPTPSAAKSSASATPSPGVVKPSVPPELTAPASDPTSVQLPKVALAALTTVPDYDIDPLLLAGLNQKLAQVQADQRRIAVQLRGQQGQLAALQAQAQQDAVAAAAAKAVAADAQRRYEELVSEAYMSSDGLSPAVDALLSPVSDNSWEAMYSANLMNTYLSSRTTQMSLALTAMQQAGGAASARLAQAERAEQTVLATQREDTAALQSGAAIKLKIQQRVAEIRRELAAKQAAQRVAASGATASWETYLSGLGGAGVQPPPIAQLRDPAHLPKGLRPLVDSAGQPQAGVAVRPTAHGSLLVLPKETIAAVGFAFAQLGKPYVFGATGPSSFDCSGLTMASYASAGVAIPRISWDQYAWAKPVKPGDEMPGDLVFFAGDDGTATHPGHVAMVIDPVKHLMIQAPQTGDVVKVSDYAHWGGLVGFGRVSTAG